MSLQAHTEKSNYDTVLAVYTGNDADVTNLQRLVCNDDYLEESGGGYSLVEFNARAGQPYYFQVSGYNGQTGNLIFAVEEFVQN